MMDNQKVSPVVAIDPLLNLLSIVFVCNYMKLAMLPFLYCFVLRSKMNLAQFYLQWELNM